MNSYSGLFVAIEGIDGSGKTTQIPLIKESLEKEGIDVHITSEPSSGRLGPILREYLSDPHSKSEVDALLFAADRVEHYFQEILPELESGKIVITDRYKASSVIYQGLSDVSEEWIIEINNRVPNPDLTILIDIPADVALERVSSDRKHLEKFETLEKLETLLNRYRTLEIGKTISIDGTLPVSQVTKNIITAIKSEI